eukprot:gene26658-4027_t
MQIYDRRVNFPPHEHDNWKTQVKYAHDMSREEKAKRAAWRRVGGWTRDEQMTGTNSADAAAQPTPMGERTDSIAQGTQPSTKQRGATHYSPSGWS